MVALGAPHQKQQGAGALIETLESARYYSSDSEYGEDKVFKNAATKKQYIPSVALMRVASPLLFPIRPCLRPTEEDPGQTHAVVDQME